MAAVEKLNKELRKEIVVDFSTQQINNTIFPPSYQPQLTSIVGSAAHNTYNDFVLSAESIMDEEAPYYQAGGASRRLSVDHFLAYFFVVITFPLFLLKNEIGER